MSDEPTMTELHTEAQRALLRRIVATEVAEKCERYANAYAILHAAKPTETPSGRGRIVSL